MTFLSKVLIDLFGLFLTAIDFPIDFQVTFMR